MPDFEIEYDVVCKHYRNITASNIEAISDIMLEEALLNGDFNLDDMETYDVISITEEK
jgi:hypothetical protein